MLALIPFPAVAQHVMQTKLPFSSLMMTFIRLQLGTEQPGCVMGFQLGLQAVTHEDVLSGLASSALKEE